MRNLAQAIDARLHEARLMGARPGRRIYIDAAQEPPKLVMTWVSATDGPMLQTNPADPTVVGDQVINIDMSKIPKGVKAMSWSALPDTVDHIDMPTKAEMLDAANMLGAEAVEHLDGQGIDAYRFVWGKGEAK